MSRKWSVHLLLLTFAFVIMIAFVFAIAYAPTVASANAAGTISTVNGEAYTPGTFVEVPYTGSGVTLTVVSTPACENIEFFDMENGAPNESLGYIPPKNLGEYCAKLYDSENSQIGDVFFRIVLADMTGVSVVQDGTLTYTAGAQTANVISSATTANGSVATFKYSRNSGSGYDDAVPSFTEAGSHTVYYKATAPNHNEATGSFTVTIGKAPLTVTAQDKATVYGSAAPSFNVVCAGFVGGQNEGYFNGSLSLSCAYDTTDPDHRNAGEYDIVPSGYTSDNYEIGFVKGTLNVAPKTLTVTANDHVISYGDAPANAGVSFNGFVYDQNATVLTGTVEYAYDYTQYDDVGDYTITPSGLTVGNYDYNYVGGKLTVQKANYNMSGVTFVNDTVVYDGEEHSLTVGGTLPTGVTVSYSGSAINVSDGAVNVTAIFATENTNYNAPGSMVAAITITAKPVAVVWDIEASWTYNGAVQNCQIASVNDIHGEPIALTVTADSTFKDKGEYLLTAVMTTANANYALTNATYQASIAAKSLAVAWNFPQWGYVYNGANQEATLQGVASVDTGVTGETVELTVVADGLFKNAGEYLLSAFQTDENYNYTLTNDEDIPVSIAPRQVAVSFNSTAKTAKYGDESGWDALGDEMEAEYMYLVTEDTVALADLNGNPLMTKANYCFNTEADGMGTEVLMSAVGPTLEVGTYYLIVESNDDNFVFVPDENFTANAQLIVTKATVTVSAKNKTVKFGNAAPAFANTDDYVEYDGFLNGDTTESLTGTLSFACAYQVGAAAGSTFDIVPSGLESANYEIEFVKGALTVAKRQLTITNKASNTPVNFVYGDASVYQLNPYDHITIGGDGIAPSDLAILQQNQMYIVLLVPMGISPHDHDHPIPVQNLSGSNFGYAATYYLHVFADNVNSNYEATVDFDEKAKLVISPKDLTVTADNKAIEYGGTPEFTVSYDGFAYDDAIKAKNLVFGGTLAFDCDYDTADPAKRAIKDGGYAITPKGITAQNYNINFNSGVLTVGKKYLLVKADNKTVTYGDAAPVFTVTYEGFVYGDDENTAGVFDENAPLVFNCDYEAGASVGTMSIAPTNLSSANYNVAFADGVLTIEARPLTITNTNTEPLSKVYGDPSVYQLNPYTVIGVDGLTAADLAILQGNPNYIAMLVPMGISPRDKTHPIALQELTGSNFGYAATYYLYVYETMINENYAVTVDFDENAKLVVSPKALTITAENKTITYGDEAPAFTVTYDGFVGGNYNDSEAKLTGTLTFDCEYDVSNSAKRRAGEYTVTPRGVSNGNYSITFVPGTLTVAPAVLSLSVTVPDTVYGTPVKEPMIGDGIVFTGWKYDDPTVDMMIPGLSPMILYFARDPQKGSFEEQYDEQFRDFDYTDTATLNNLYSHLAVPTEAGEYYVTATFADVNYQDIVVFNTFTIAKKAVTVTAANKESLFEEDLVALTATDTGILAGDAVYTLSTTADKNKAGAYPIVVALTGNGNYDVTVVNGTYTVKTNVIVDTDDNGETVVEANKKIDDEAAKSEEGVSIKNAIQNVLSASADASEATLKVKIGEKAAVTFDKAALRKLAENGDVKISYSETKAEDITDKDLKGAALVIEISLSGASFEGGKATIVAAFENKAPGGKKAVVYYVDANGKKTDMKAVFADGTVSFETTHFSTYVVEYVLTGGAIAGIVIGCVAGAAAIAIGVFFFLKKRNAKNSGAEQKAAE